MKIIQLILVPAFILLVVMYFRRFRSLLFDRLLVLSFGVVGSLLVMMPDWTVRLARWVGVGRGTDLVLYFSIVGFIFISFILFSKLRALEDRMTELARFEAIEHPRSTPPKPKENRNKMAEGVN